MILKKPVGKGSSTRKYDLLTVLGSFALSQDKNMQRLTLRFICLITARYNWQTNALSSAQTEIAKLWSCDPRTVKREMASLRKLGWLVERNAAGRGRATVYGLGIEKIMEDTQNSWENVGRDLVQRLGGETRPEPADDNKIIPFPQIAAPQTDSSVWGMIAQRLYHEDPAVFQAWFAALQAKLEDNALILQAAGSFHTNYINTHLRPRIERHLHSLAPGLQLVLA